MLLHIYIHGTVKQQNQCLQFMKVLFFSPIVFSNSFYYTQTTKINERIGNHLGITGDTVTYFVEDTQATTARFKGELRVRTFPPFIFSPLFSG